MLRLLALTILNLVLSSCVTIPSRPRPALETLLVWAGDQAHKSPDFLAVVDFGEYSPTYGKVLKTIPLAQPNAIGNEPHHLGLSADGRTLALGGLLSILRKQDQVYFFDVSNARDPKFIRSDNPSNASITDEFEPLKNGGFLVTFMGGADGANPGRVVEYDAKHNLVKAWPENPPKDGFNPHGISINEDHNLMVTSDFICPLRTLHVEHGGEVILRGTIRVWDLKNRTITRTIQVGDPDQPAGTIDVKLIPKDSKLRAFTAGMADNKLYLIDTKGGLATPVFDFSPYSVDNAPTWPQLIRINQAGTRMFITLNYAGLAGKIIMFDIKNPEAPKVLSIADLGPQSGPHYLQLSKDEKRLIVSDYFLNEDLSPGGVVHAEGDHKIHVFKVSNESLTLDPNFNLDFNRDISTGPARPHGLVAF